MFPKEQRLTRKRDLQKLYRRGQTAGTSWLYARALPSSLPHSRFSVVIGKKVAKKAVVRNRLKRLVRQAICELQREGSTPKLARIDAIVTIHRDPESPYTLERIKPEVQQCFERLPSA